MLSGLTQYVPEATLTVYDNLEFLIRLLLSAALGALVGLERSKRRKEAGIRTHCIIACTCTHCRPGGQRHILSGCRCHI